MNRRFEQRPGEVLTSPPFLKSASCIKAGSRSNRRYLSELVQAQDYDEQAWRMKTMLDCLFKLAEVGYPAATELTIINRPEPPRYLRKPKPTTLTVAKGYLLPHSAQYTNNTKMERYLIQYGFLGLALSELPDEPPTINQQDITTLENTQYRLTAFVVARFTALTDRLLANA